ncbi:putative protein N(5)-glutamine methyltransferase [Streptomyces triticagri]|uniref:peptide chain release factor N(5)-glutamine methyltransferase n=1 Tax=Streptomyces triticagri TaxID=2293568 RepID=A0A372M236_9ACTN|nr:putative protein N(5)-glutamine methyltransferase [Streptomyces triticagri]RFU85004.1 putative protein N(5)-glutamine methyltransferase [Streptomyces triticagri]
MPPSFSFSSGSPASSSAAGPTPVFADVVAELRAAGCVFAEDEARLLLEAADTPDRLATLVRRRADGLPLEHLLGWAEFCGLRIAVGPGVFVPRRRTEFLAGRAAGLARPGSVVVDLCCGSGAVAAAVAEAVPDVVLHAADVEASAVHWARHNVTTRGGRVHRGDLYGALPAELRGRVDVLVVNAPYVPTGSLGLMPPEARDHEPRVALDGGADGLDVQRRVAAGAPDWLAPGGSLLIETGERQSAGTLAAMTAAGLDARVESCAELWATVVVGTLGDGGPDS